MEHVKLHNGLEIPILGFGVFQIPDQSECERCVIDALNVGYRHIDTAASYMNEEAVGRAIRKSGIDRSEIFVTTKLWIQRDGYKTTKQALENSLRRLGLDYVDLYLIHQPFGDVYGEWRSMEEAYREGKAKAIGISNFHTDRVMDIIVHNEVVPMANQIEINPFHQQIEAIDFLKNHKIAIEAWAPFAEGRNGLFENETLKKIAARHKKTVAQVVLRWVIQKEVIALAKTTTKSRMIENINIFDFVLSENDMKAIESLNRNSSNFFDHRDPEKVKWLGERRLEL